MKPSELTTNNRASKKLEPYSFNYPRAIEESRKKRTFQFPFLLKSQIDESRLLFPRGILSKVKEGLEDIPPVKRIELFAKDGEDTYGIIRSIFVGLSSERSILEIAETSGGVVQVRVVRSGRGNAKDASISEGSGDVILLKRLSEESEETTAGFRVRIPSITISPRWGDRMRISEGDCLMVSNPIQNYAVPPPNM